MPGTGVIVTEPTAPAVVRSPTDVLRAVVAAVTLAVLVLLVLIWLEARLNTE